MALIINSIEDVFYYLLQDVQEANITGEVSLDNYYTKTEIDDKFSETGEISLDNYYTKTETDDKFSEIETLLREV